MLPRQKTSLILIGPIIIKRFHLFEFCDQPWVKGWMREGFMDCLATMYRFSNPYGKFSEYILENLHEDTVYDLATGTGESIEPFLKFLHEHHTDHDIKIIGTDLFPNPEILTHIKGQYPHFDYIEHPINALNPPEGDNASYLMFTGFHHFKPDEATAMIQTCLSKGKSLTILELTRRYGLFSYIFSVLSVFILMPTPFFAKKWRWQKFVFSLIPVIPFMVGFDGVVSNLRTYTKTELEQLAQNAFPTKTIKVEFQQRRYGLLFKSYICRFSID